MKRLTMKGFAWNGTSNFRDIGRWNLAECLNRLSAYEDTGLTPEEINALRERDTAKAPESLVIRKGVKTYSCQNCGNMIGGSDDFCPKCGQRLKLATETQRPEWQERMLHTFLGGHK